MSPSPATPLWTKALLALALLPIARGAMAQPICAINLGADRTICAGETVQLDGPVGFSSYLWSTGAVTPNITVGAAGNYWCQVSYPVTNLVTNGNFSAGNTGFSSDFSYNSNLTSDGRYYIGTNAANHHPQFSGTGSGNFMMVNSGWPSALYHVWCQQVTTCPGQTYTLSYRARTLSNEIPARLQWWIDGAPVGPEVNLPAFGSGWQTITQTWTTATGQTAPTICLRAMSGEGVGNDFGLDDISLTGTIVLTDDVLVNVTALPAFDLGPNATLCTGQTLLLDAGVPGGTYLWQDASTGPSFNVSGPGTYSVTVTANNCSATDQITVGYNPTPAVDLGPDETLCAGETLTLDATTPGATYVWQDGSTAPTFTVSGPGTYGVSVLLNGCTASDAVDVAYNPLPVVDLGPDVTLCAGEQTTFDATTAGATYLWQDGSTGPTFTTGTAGSYSATVTVNGCSSTDGAAVVVNPVPVVDLGPDATVCPGTDVLLDASTPGATYLWQDGSTAATFTASAPGTYTVDVTVANCTGSGSITIDHFNLHTVDLGPDIDLCQGASTTIGVVVPGATYTWSTGAVTPTISVGSAGIRWVDVTLNGCTVRDSIAVDMVPLPVVDLGPDVSLCPGTTAVLDATTVGGSYAWSTGVSTPTITAGPGNYSVTVTVAGCSASDAITIGTHAVVPVSLGNDVTLCAGEQLVLDATLAGATYLWSDGSTGPTLNVTATGTISVQRTDANGCVTTDAVDVTFENPIALDLGPDITLCAGEAQTINAPVVPGASYLWSTGAQTPSITVSTAGNYGLTMVLGACQMIDAVNVAVLAPPVVDLGPDLSLCPGESAVLDATTPGATYTWSTGANTPTITVDVAGNYSVTVEVGGCQATDAIGVGLLAPASVDLGPDVSICSGTDLVLDATMSGASYLWSTGALTPTITVSTAGNYSVVVSLGQCSASDAINVTVQPTPTVDLGGDQVLCNGETDVLLDATTAGATYLWSTGAQTATLQVGASGTYSVNVDLNGCTNSDEVDITFGTLTLDLGVDTTLCPGATLELEVPFGNGTVLWNNAAGGSTFTVTTAGAYWAEFTPNAGGCSVTDTIQVDYTDPGTLDLGPDASLCEGATTTLDATLPGATYLWSTGATTPTITVGASGTYAVTATVGDCTVQDAVTVTVNPLPQPDIGADASICPGSSTTFDATTPGATYLWHDGSTGPTFTTGLAGQVDVAVTLNGCTGTDDALVSMLDGPVVELGGDTTLCAPASLVLDAGQPGASYLWSDGSTGPTLTVDTEGTYGVTVTLNGCTATDAINVQVFAPSSVDLGPDLQLCPGATAQLSPGLPDMDHLWSTGATSASITVGTAGSYWVEVGIAGCSLRDSVQVIVVDLPTPDLGEDITLCSGDTAHLSVAPGNASILWSTSATTASIPVWEAGQYTVTLQLAGCLASDAIAVNVMDSITSVDLGDDTTICLGSELLLQAPVVAGAIYTWNTGASTASFLVTGPGEYGVHAEGPCMLAQATIVITEGECGPYIHVPNAFTPNNDDINDVFLPVIDGDLRAYRLDVHDRWGELIFSSAAPGDAWDGTYNGTAVQDGVYVWTLTYRAESSEGKKQGTLRGHVTLLR